MDSSCTGYKLIDFPPGDAAGFADEIGHHIAEIEAEPHPLDPFRFTPAGHPIPLARFERNYRDDNEKYRQDNRKLKQGFLHAPLGAVNAISLPEDAPKPATPHLKQNGKYQRYRQNNLGNYEIKIHNYLLSNFFFIKSPTICGLARPFVTFITCPTRNLDADSFPAL